jgi:tRNA(Ile)-lysidine synthase
MNLNLKLITNQKNIAVACSGGADSLALTLMLQDYCKKNKKKLIALTVDHKLRKTSLKEAKQVTKWLEKYGIKHEILSHNHPIPKSNIEAWGRELRYNLMTEFCAKNGYDCLLTGHHADDQLETFFMRLERGSGLFGLTGIPEKSEYNFTYKNKTTSLKILRPILDATKAELEDYLKGKKQKWVIDESNFSPKFKRNEIRAILEKISDKKLLQKRVLDTVKSLSLTRDFIEEELAKTEKNLVLKSAHNDAKISLTEFKNLHAEIGLRLLKKLLIEFGNQNEIPRFEGVERIYNKLISGDFKSATLNKCLVSIKKNQIIFENE